MAAGAGTVELEGAPDGQSRVLSGIKPTGPLHLGNLEGAVRSWVELQRDHEVFCMIANWHAYAGAPRSGEQVQRDTTTLSIDLLAAGIDPDRTALFRQSDVKEHAELYLLLSMITPLSWLQRVPAAREAMSIEQSSPVTHGLLGYPVLQAADILLYRAHTVPVGSDQLPHLELAREMVRRFHRLYGPVFVEPHAYLGSSPLVPGLDGRKMSKSRGNAIYLADDPGTIAAKVRRAFTTPTKVRATDPGIPEGCTVCQLRRLYDPDGFEPSWDEDRRGVRGCMENKLELIAILERVMQPIRTRRASFERVPDEVERILQAGAARARAIARDTIADVRRAMRLT